MAEGEDESDIFDLAGQAEASEDFAFPAPSAQPAPQLQATARAQPAASQLEIATPALAPDALVSPGTDAAVAASTIPWPRR